jgi:hypothetical protein
MTNLPMSNVNLSVSSDKYIVAETAKLIFQAVYAIQDSTVDARSEVIKAANELVPDGEWYVTGMTRAEDNSGIETATYTLSVRVKESILNTIKVNLKTINRPGLKFKQIETDYTPTKTQIENAMIELRTDIYNKAMAEVAVLNSTCTDDSAEKWIVGSVNFNSNDRPVLKNMRATVAATTYNSFNSDDVEDESGITQRVSLSADIMLTRKIYSRL